MLYLRGFGAILAVSALLLLMGAAAGEGARAQLSTSNADKLSLLWDFPLGAGVTARPVLANGLLYAASWDGSIYALDPETGALTWSFNTFSGAIIGSQSTPLLRCRVSAAHARHPTAHRSRHRARPCRCHPTQRVRAR